MYPQFFCGKRRRIASPLLPQTAMVLTYIKVDKKERNDVSKDMKKKNRALKKAQGPTQNEAQLKQTSTSICKSVGQALSVKALNQALWLKPKNT